MVKNFTKKARGFTLIEILVVIGIIAILAAIVIIAINPARQFAQARNTTRESNVSTILNAIGQNIADNKGVFTCSTGKAISSTLTDIEDLVTPSGTLVDLDCLTPTYIPTAIPTDPGGTVGGATKNPGTTADTGYQVSVDSVGRYTVCAPNHAESAFGASAVTYCLTR